MSIPDSAASELVSGVRSVINETGARDEFEVESRVCDSDKNTGVELTLKGPHIRLRPVIEFFDKTPEWKIENINMVPDSHKIECPECEERIYQNSIVIFCAYIDEEPNGLSNVFV
jgi:hypothetical protein